MIPLNRTYAPIQAFVDELARCGVRHAVTSPGSRNAPLLLGLAGEPRIATHSVLDERSAGFVALAIAKVTETPVAITCTSGSAAANLHPALVEARESRIPLLVLTADRPPELREVGAGQSIDQVKLYGSSVKWFVDVGTHEPGRETAVHMRALACRAFFTAAGGRPGPVHLNFPLREPLAPVAEELDPEQWRGRAGGEPWARVEPSPPEATADVLDAVAERIAATPRGAIVCGPGADRAAAAVAALAAATGWPVLADALSGVRCGPHDRSAVVAHYDVLLRHPSFAEAHRPELVLRVGDTPTSKPLRAWLAGASEQIVLDADAIWHEPTRQASLFLPAEPGPTCAALAARLEGRRVEGGWLGSWRRADDLIPPVLDAAPDPCEPKLLAALAPVLTDGDPVWVSSSMPVRDVESYFPQGPAEIRFLANRGANGIDGIPSSAAGAALATGRRAFLLTGELALLHDLGGLPAARRLGAELTVICLNNGGGGIFDFLPVATHAEDRAYEEQIVTPHDVDLARLAALAGLDHTLVTTPDELRAAAAGPGLIEARTDRRRNVELHRELVAQVGAALERG